MMSSTFKLQAIDDRARNGFLKLNHGVIETPVFMPVGTYGSVKTLAPYELKELGAEIILCNTYHLFLRPGNRTVKELGGINKFISWDNPILTDSGGFQIYSLAELRNISDEGVIFKSHINGESISLTPETPVIAQTNLLLAASPGLTMSISAVTPA